MLNKVTINSRLKKYSTLISNFNYLSILQLFQLLFPLIIYPYLIRMLGKEIYGLVVYANSIALFFQIFINFGFEISEIREISIWREDKIKVSGIVSSVITIKTAIATILILLFLTGILLIPNLREHKFLYIATFGLLVDTAINPRFYFQGIEKMKFITILTVSSRLIFLILIFVFVTKPQHYVLVPLLTSIGLVSGSLIGLYIAFKKHQIIYYIPNLSSITSTINNSLPFFASRVSVFAINRTNVLLIGSFIGYSEVAYYDLAEKLVNVMKMPFNIFNQVLFPSVSKTKNVQLVKKTLLLLLGIYIAGYLSLYFLSEPIIKIIGGPELLPSKYVLYILGINSITELISVLLGAPMLLALGYKKQYNFSIIKGSIFYVFYISALYLFNLVDLYSLATATVASSAFIMIYRLYFCRRFKLI